MTDRPKKLRIVVPRIMDPDRPKNHGSSQESRIIPRIMDRPKNDRSSQENTDRPTINYLNKGRLCYQPTTLYGAFVSKRNVHGDSHSDNSAGAVGAHVGAVGAPPFLTTTAYLVHQRNQVHALDLASCSIRLSYKGRILILTYSM